MVGAIVHFLRGVPMATLGSKPVVDHNLAIFTTLSKGTSLSPFASRKQWMIISIHNVEGYFSSVALQAPICRVLMEPCSLSPLCILTSFSGRKETDSPVLFSYKWRMLCGWVCLCPWLYIGESCICSVYVDGLRGCMCLSTCLYRYVSDGRWEVESWTSQETHTSCMSPERL